MVLRHFAPGSEFKLQFAFRQRSAAETRSSVDSERIIKCRKISA